MTVGPVPYLSQEPCDIIISPGHPSAATCDPMMHNASSTSVSGTWPAINQAIGIPFIVTKNMAAKVISVENGAAVSGNVDVGIYSEDGTLIVSKGTTAQAGVSTIQTFDITDTALPPAVYFLAMSMDNTTGQVLRSTGMLVQMAQVSGIVIATSGFVLPSTITWAKMTSTFIPAISLHAQTVI